MDLGEFENAWFCFVFWGDLKSVLRLPCDCPATVLRLPCDCPATALRLSCDCIATVLRLWEFRQSVDGRLHHPHNAEYVKNIWFYKHFLGLYKL